MKPWQIIAGFCASLVIIGLLLCDDIRTHSDLRDCEKAVGLKPETTLVITHPPKDSQKPQGVGVHPIHNPDTHYLSALKPSDTGHPARDSAKGSIPGAPGLAGVDSGKIDTTCIDDTTTFPDGEKIRHSVCSPDIKPGARITGLWTFRERPAETTKTVSKPIIMYRTPIAARWYIQLSAGALVAWLGYEAGKRSNR